MRRAAINQLRLELFPPGKGKYCSGKCGLWRPWSHYNRASKRKDGHQAWCRQCSNSSRGSMGGRVQTVARTAEPICKCCLGLSHRRPARGCARCGEPFVPLEAEIEAERNRLRQGFGLGRVFAWPDMKGV